MTQTVEAIYENGILRPVQRLEGIDERARVRITVETESPDRPVLSEQAKPIWEVAQELMSDVPEVVRRELPTDGADQHDHYVYGIPKRP